ncbi:hypothetical protein [Thermococcus sp.]|uniref:hypothetical protein n=1 Tax=Thermococcus sp. TaxID=35749 RepID=UPI00262AD15C|nr:hypothetical protein [Thermococcus sp.]
MLSRKLLPLLLIAVVFTAGCIGAHGHKSTPSIPLKPVACPAGENLTLVNNAHNVTLKDPSYRLAVDLMKSELEEVRALYRVATSREGNENVLRSLSNISLLLLSNSTVINETVIRVGNATYNYVVLSVYDYNDPDCDGDVEFSPNILRVNNIAVRLTPSNWTRGTVTYTGIPYSTYMVGIGNETCKASFTELSTLIVPYLTAGNYLLLIDGGKDRLCRMQGSLYTVHFGFFKKDSEERKEASLLLVKR